MIMIMIKWCHLPPAPLCGAITCRI